MRKQPRRNPITPAPPLSDPDGRWSRELMQTPAQDEWKKRRAVGKAMLPGGQTLVLKRRVDPRFDLTQYLWYVTVGAARQACVIAAGTAVEDREIGRRFITHVSVVDPAYRASGLYTAVLRALRRIVGAPIESDTSLTAGAIGAWRKAGGVETKRLYNDVMRINPRTTMPRKNPAPTQFHEYVLMHRQDYAKPGAPDIVGQMTWTEGDVEATRSGYGPVTAYSLVRRSPHAARFFRKGKGYLRGSHTVTISDDPHVALMEYNVRATTRPLSDADLRKIGAHGYMIMQEMLKREAELNRAAKLKAAERAARRNPKTTKPRRNQPRAGSQGKRRR